MLLHKTNNDNSTDRVVHIYISRIIYEVTSESWMCDKTKSNNDPLQIIYYENFILLWSTHWCFDDNDWRNTDIVL